MIVLYIFLLTAGVLAVHTLIIKLIKPIKWSLAAKGAAWQQLQFFQKILRMVGFLGQWFWLGVKQRLTKAELFHNALMSPREQRWILSRWNHGICIDGRRHLTKKESYSNAMILGAVGRGKSSVLMIPGLLRLHKSLSAVVTDPSGELYAATAGHLAKRNFNVLVVRFDDAGNSLGINPIQLANTQQELKELALLIEQNSYEHSQSTDGFWGTGGTTITYILLRVLKRLPEKYQNFANLRYLLNNWQNPSVKALIETYADEETLHDYNGQLANTENVGNNFVTSAKNSVDTFSDPNLARLTCQNTLDLSLLRKEKTVLFLIMPSNKVHLYRFMLTLAFNAIFQELEKPPVPKQPYRPVVCYCEEFANSGFEHIKSFPQVANTYRKLKISLVMVVQSINQVYAMFGEKKAASIIDGAVNTFIYLPGQKFSTCKELSELIGTRSVEYVDIDGSTKTAIRPVLTPQQIRGLDDRKLILVSSNRPPAILKSRPFYRNFWQWLKTKLPTPELAMPPLPDKIEYVPLPKVQAESTTPPQTKRTSTGAPRPHTQQEEFSWAGAEPSKNGVS